MLSTGQDAIRYADTKLSLLLTAAAVAVPTLRDHAVWLADRWDADSALSLASATLGGLGYLLFAMTIVTAGHGLAPRLRWPAPTAAEDGPLTLNRFAWPTIVGRAPTDVLSLPVAGARAEAAHQVVALSAIADRKFRRFAVALWMTLSGAAFVALSALISWGLPPTP